MSLNRFRAVRLSQGLQREFDLPEVICANPDGLPFPEGQAFRLWIIEENACLPATADNYLHLVLPFLTFLWHASPPLAYAAPVEQVRERIREYLRERLGYAARPHRGGNFVVVPMPRPVTRVTIPSVRTFLVALRRFYDCAILKGWYREANPLIWAERLMLQEHNFVPGMPPLSGLSAPQEKRGRVPAMYFCVAGSEWQPHIIDDPQLPRRLTLAFSCLRDRIVARMLFESGARVSEILGLTYGDWRRRDLRDRATAPSKGSHGERVKEVWWSSDTARLLQRYINEDRRHSDPQHRNLNGLPDSAFLFLTNEGAPYRYPAFYFHWRQACKQAGVKVHPHQTRHWFVTIALRRINTLPAEEQEGVRDALVAYMGWRNPQTITVYDHYLCKANFGETHAAVSKLVQPGGKQAPDLSAVSAGQARPPASADGVAQWLYEQLNGVLDAQQEAA